MSSIVRVDIIFISRKSCLNFDEEWIFIKIKLKSGCYNIMVLGVVFWIWKLILMKEILNVIFCIYWK